MVRPDPIPNSAVKHSLADGSGLIDSARVGCRQIISKSRDALETHFGFLEKLAATYSRGSYTTTTIGKAAFDGRVRNGIGSDHSFMATKVFTDGHGRFAAWCSVLALPVMTLNLLKNIACSLKTTHRDTRTSFSLSS